MSEQSKPSYASPSVIATPSQLAKAYHSSGAFDALRRSLLADFLASPGRTHLDEQLDELLPRVVAGGSKSQARKERHAEVLSALESRHTVLPRAVSEVERGVRAREKESERLGNDARIRGALERTLRRSRGELVPDPLPEQKPDTTALPTPPHPSASSSLPSSSSTAALPPSQNPSFSLVPPSDGDTTATTLASSEQPTSPPKDVQMGEPDPNEAVLKVVDPPS